MDVTLLIHVGRIVVDKIMKFWAIKKIIVQTIN